jgi:hypothetical protein
MADRDVDKIVTEAQEGTDADKKAAACRTLEAKVARQPKGSARRKMAQRALDACRARQSTDDNQ